MPFCSKHDPRVETFRIMLVTVRCWVFFIGRKSLTDEFSWVILTETLQADFGSISAHIEGHQSDKGQARGAEVPLP